MQQGESPHSSGIRNGVLLQLIILPALGKSFLLPSAKFFQNYIPFFEIFRCAGHLPDTLFKIFVKTCKKLSQMHMISAWLA